jgi:hypothetical protein
MDGAALEEGQMRIVILGLGAAALLTACATLTSDKTPNAFQAPQTYLHKQTTVCGYLSGATTIRPKRQEIETGLNLDANRFATQLLAIGEAKKVCVSGPISYMGCANDPNVICTDAAFDYNIRVDSVF